MKPLFSLTTALLILLATANCSVLFKRSANRSSLFRKGQDGEGDAADMPSDTESLLGKDDAKTFEQLQPKEKRQRLSDLVSEKIDLDRDGFVTHDEMIHWLAFVRQRYLQAESKLHWDKLNVTGQQLTWLEYKSKAYGKEEGMGGGSYDDELQRSMIAQDLRRFKIADEDNSAGLTLAEFVSFLHPEDFVHMRPTVMLDAMDDVDSNGDSFVDESEYIAAMWQPEQNETATEEPEWVSRERLLYKTWRDLDHDGKLNRDEVQRWTAPLDRNHSVAESQHLIRQSDIDKDGKLTLVEILNKFDMFVQSEATDYGDALVGQHDEL